MGVLSMVTDLLGQRDTAAHLPYECAECETRFKRDYIECPQCESYEIERTG